MENIDQEKNEEVKDHKLPYLILLFVLVFLIWLGSIYYLDSKFSWLEEKSLYGSSFGFISSLFSGLAFAGIIYTILLQRTELALQRKELKETRKVLEKTAEAQVASAAQFVRQSNNMKVTARLNAMNTLIENANKNISSIERKRPKDIYDKDKLKKLKMEKENYLKEIKRVLEFKDT